MANIIVNTIHTDTDFVVVGNSSEVAFSSLDFSTVIVDMIMYT